MTYYMASASHVGGSTFCDMVGLAYRERKKRCIGEMVNVDSNHAVMPSAVFVPRFSSSCRQASSSSLFFCTKEKY